MTNTVEWTPQERQRLKRLQDGEADARTLHNGRQNKRNYVTSEDCEWWRTRIREYDVIPERVDGRGFAEATIRKHASGECTHEDIGPPVVYDDGEWVVRE